MLNRIKGVEPQKIFLVLALIYGLCFLASVGPFMVADEPSHFYRAFQVSDGLIGWEGGVGYIPQSVNTTSHNFVRTYDGKHMLHDIKLSFETPLNNNDRTYIGSLKVNPSTIPIANYSAIPYLAVAFVILVGKFFNTSPLALMYLGRLANLLVWILLTYLAIKITPVHKWAFLVLALMPMTLIQAASISADSLTIGISFLFVAFIFKLAFDDNKKVINKVDIALIFLMMILLVLSKNAYVFLMLLILMIPSYKFGGNKKRFLTYIIAFALFSTVIAYSFNLGGIVGSSNSNPDPRLVQGEANSMSDIISDPLGFASLCLGTFITYHFYINSFVGTLCWTDSFRVFDWRILYFIFLLMVSLMDKTYIKIRKRDKLIMAGIVVLFTGGLILSSYLHMTGKGSSLLNGIQGRYFIPIAPLFCLLFYNNKKTIKLGSKIFNLKLNRDLKPILIILLIIFLTIGVLMVLKLFYGHYIFLGYSFNFIGPPVL